jgi:hypothetical protein
MSTNDESTKPQLSLVPLAKEGPAQFGARDRETFIEKRTDREDRRKGVERRSMIRFTPNGVADRRSAQDRRRTGHGWRGRDL